MKIKHEVKGVFSAHVDVNESKQSGDNQSNIQVRLIYNVFEDELTVSFLLQHDVKETT